ncbi:hypothetical protein Cgig2_027073 [Carnegiea gigantea]|uniref:Caffeoyl-CoA O-methyltransferase n=1 Tax=Carnegiea gigantea TaxID=171969 RepID=A0A9Q1K9I3_9CARY|nr:hypothetical protein Cgig2_027073 [Carnegiea gigantea]
MDSYPNEHPQLKELKTASFTKYGSRSIMSVPADEAQCLSMLLKLTNAKNTLEIGVFVGYSLLSTALPLPDDGKVIAIDPDKEAYEVAMPFIREAGVEHKIEVVESTASPILTDLLNNGKEGTFDFAFVDADKESYIDYHEKLLKLVKVGGVIGYDNTLWWGSVAYPDDVDFFKDFTDHNTEKGRWRQRIREQIKKFNSYLASDPRVETTLLSIVDGLTLCRRKY